MSDLPEFIELPADKTVKDLVAKLDRPYSLKVWTGRNHHGSKKLLADIDGDTLTLYKGVAFDSVKQAAGRMQRGATKSTRKHSAAVKTLLQAKKTILQGQDIVTWHTMVIL